MIHFSYTRLTRNSLFCLEGRNMLTIILALTGCLLLFLVIWGITITLPTDKLLVFSLKMYRKN